MHKVLKAFKGSPDGFTVIQFNKDDVVGADKLSGDLLKVALQQKWVAVEKEKAPPKDSKKEKGEKIEAIKTQITEVEGALAAADEAGKPEIQEKLDALNKELTNLD